MSNLDDDIDSQTDKIMSLSYVSKIIDISYNLTFINQ